MKILPKELLSIEGVAKYLERFNCKYNLELPSEYLRLKSDIYDLACESKVSAMFYYQGEATKTTEQVEYIDYEKYSQRIVLDMWEEANLISGYCKVCSLSLRSIFLDCDAVPIDGWLITPEPEPTANAPKDYEYSYRIKSNKHLSLADIRIPLEDLNNLFNTVQLTKIEDLETSLATARKTYADQKDTISLLSKELKAAQDSITALTDELRQAQTSQPSDDKELEWNSQASVTKILYALLAAHSYELTPEGKGKANETILNALNQYGASVSKNTVAKWLKRAYLLSIDITKTK